MYKHFSPLVVFTYLRFNKLKKLINKLKSNKISKQTEIIFFSDFAKDKSELEKVKRVRNYLFKINGFKKKDNFEKGKLRKWKKYY